MNTQQETMSGEDVQRNIDRLIAKHELLNGRMRRSGLILFGLMALYLFIHRGALKDVDLGYFNLSDMDLIRLLLMPLYAAYYLYFSVTGFEMSKVNGVLGMFMGETNPLKHNPNIMSVLDIRSALLPYSFFEYFSDSRWEVIPKWSRILVGLLFTMILGAILIPHVFIAHLLVSHLSTALDLLGWCSAIATIILLYLTVAIQYVYFRVNYTEHRARLSNELNARSGSSIDH